MSRIGWILGGLAAVGLGLAVFDSKPASAAALPPSPPGPLPPTPAPSPTPAPAPSIPASYLPPGWKPGDPIPPEIQAIAQTLAAAAAQVKPPPSTPAERRRIAATELEEELRRTKPGQENQAFVKVYQSSTNGEVGKVDGKYGPKTALGLARDLGHVPPEPRVWPAGKDVRKERAQYLRDLAQIVTVAK